jgi:hypothetical protein
MRSHTTPAPRVAWLAAGVGLIAASVQISRSLTLPLWQDEVATARIVVAPTWIRALHGVVDEEATPPLYYAIVWFLHRVGLGVMDLRLVSVMGASLAAAATVLIAHRVTGTLVALSAGLLVAVGWQPVSHGAELRAYALLLVAVCAFSLAVIRVMESPSRTSQALLAGVVLVGSFTHYCFLLSVVSLLLLPVVSARARERVRPAGIAIGIGLLPALAWLPALMAQHRRGRFSWIGSFRPRDVLATYSDQQFPHLPGNLGSMVAVSSVALVGLGVARLARQDWRGQVIAILASGPPAIAALLWAFGEPIFLARNLIGVAPFAAIAFWSGVTWIVRRQAVAIATVPVLALGLASTSLVLDHEHRPPPFDRVAATLAREGWTSADPIVVVGSVYAYLFPLSWYLPGRPDLETAVTLGTACPRVFVVVAGGRAPLTLGTADVEARVAGSRVSVSRFRWRPADAAPLRRMRAHYVIDPHALEACTRRQI